MKQKININPMSEDHISCEVCHRTMLKGEQAEPYLTPSRERRLVCQLCAPRAQQEGWIREAAAPEMPARPARQPERRGILRRRRRRGTEDADAPPAPVADPGERRPANGDTGDPDQVARSIAQPDQALATAQPAPGEGRAHQCPAQDRPRPRAVQHV